MLPALTLLALIVAGSLTLADVRGAEPSSSGPASRTFGFQPGLQTFTVPASTYYLSVAARGGHGGTTKHTPAGGPAGLVETVLPVQPGQQVGLQVGQYGVSKGGAGLDPGGRHGYTWGPSSGHSGAGGGGATGIALSGSAGPWLAVIAGGGGGGGGNDGSGAVGGAGGAGGLPAEPGAPGWNSDDEPNQEGLHGGCAGCRPSGAGAGGERTQFSQAHGGGGGGGGGGVQGGGGGDNGVYRFEQVDDIGGSGGGGRSSWVSSQALLTKYGTGSAPCDGTAPGAGCDGSVTLSWGAPPASARIHSGDGGKATVTRELPPVSVLVTDARGIPVTGVDVRFELPAAAPSGTFSGGSRQASKSTGPNGIATAPPIVAGESAGSWSGKAIVAGLSGSVPFRLTNVAARTRAAITAVPSPSYYGEGVDVAASVASEVAGFPPTGMVLFKLDGGPLGSPVVLDASGRAELPPAELPDVAVGSHRLEADYLGDPGHSPSVGVVNHRVLPIPVSVAVAGSPNPSDVGEQVELTATVRPHDSPSVAPTGTVEFSTAGGSLGTEPLDGSGAALITTDALPLGSTPITAAYSGDSAFSAASGSFSQSVGPEATSTTVSSSASPSTFGEPVSWTATVLRSDQGAALQGEVGFTLDGETVCPAAPLDTAGEVECAAPASLAAGTHEVLASYVPPGSSGDLPSSGRLAQVVAAARTTTAGLADPEPSTFGLPLTLTATVAVPGSPGLLPLGSVAFSSDGEPVGAPAELRDGTARVVESCSPGPEPCDLAPGDHLIEAEYEPAGADLDPSRVLVPHRVEPARAAVELSSSAADPPAFYPVSFSARVSAPGAGVPYGRVLFTVDGESIGEPVTLAAGRATSPPVRTLREGSHLITAHYSGSIPFEPAEARIEQRVTAPDPDRGTPTFAVDSSRAKVDRHGSLWLELTCHGEEGDRCRGGLRLRTSGPALTIRAGGPGRFTVPIGRALASRRVSLMAGSSRRLRVDLTHVGARVVSATPRLPAEVKIRPRSGTASFAAHRVELRGRRAPRATIRGRRLHASGRMVSARVRCAAPRDQRCRVRLRVVSGGRLLASGGRAIAGRRSAIVRLRLRRWAQPRLRRHPIRARAEARSVLRVGIARTSRARVVIR